MTLSTAWSGIYCREADFTELCRTDMRAISARAYVVTEAMRATGIGFQELGGSWHSFWEQAAAITDGHVDRRSRVLIVGTAATPLTFLLAAEGVEVWAVSDNLDVCRAARAMAAALGLCVRVVLAEAGALPFADDAFQRVFVLRVSEMGPGPEPILAEAVRVLGPGGRIVASVVSGGSRPHLATQAKTFSQVCDLPVLGGVQTERPPDTAAETIGLILLAKPGRIDLPISHDMHVDPLPLLRGRRSEAA
jgi:SAM-dependent methyltransferase